MRTTSPLAARGGIVVVWVILVDGDGVGVVLVLVLLFHLSSAALVLGGIGVLVVVLGGILVLTVSSLCSAAGSALVSPSLPP